MNVTTVITIATECENRYGKLVELLVSYPVELREAIIKLDITLQQATQNLNLNNYNQ